MKQKKQYVIVFVLLAIFLAVTSYRFFYRSITKDEYTKVVKGMDRAEVQELLGEPLKVEHFHSHAHGHEAEGAVVEAWYYNVKYSLAQAAINFKQLGQEQDFLVFDKMWGFTQAWEGD